MALPLIAYYVIFCYIPMYGVVAAFQDFKIGSGPGRGFFGSPFVGLKHFIRFFNSPTAFRTVKNTLLLGFYSILWSFPVPIFFALMLNEMAPGKYKKFVQSISYFPRFISSAVMCGLIIIFLDPYTGIVNRMIVALGGESTVFLMKSQYFRTVFIFTDVWQFFGWNSIIYLAAISSIDPTLYESAEIDGASRFRKITSITLPCLMPTVVILLILTLGNLMSVSFDKVLLLQNEVTYEVSDVIQTYVYRVGLLRSNYSFGSAVGLLNSVTNCVLLVTFNFLSNKLTKISLF